MMWLLYTLIAVIFIVAMAYAGYKLAQVDLRRSGFTPRSKEEAPGMDKDIERQVLEEIRQVENHLGDLHREIETGFAGMRRELERVEQGMRRLETAKRSDGTASQTKRRSTEQTGRQGTLHSKSPSETTGRARQ